MYGFLLASALAVSAPSQCINGQCAIRPVFRGVVVQRVVERPAVRRTVARVVRVRPLQRVVRWRPLRGRVFGRCR
jgi:hypothetical protein